MLKSATLILIMSIIVYLNIFHLLASTLNLSDWNWNCYTMVIYANIDMPSVLSASYDRDII